MEKRNGPRRLVLRPLHHVEPFGGAAQANIERLALTSTFDSLAMLLAMRRASSMVSTVSVPKGPNEAQGFRPIRLNQVSPRLRDPPLVPGGKPRQERLPRL